MSSSEKSGLLEGLDAYNAIIERLNLHKGIPYSHNWSAAADFLNLIIEHCLKYRPETVFECSSGLTTLMLARCCQMNNHGHVYSLENGSEYADKTRGYLAMYGLSNYATVIDAPLERYVINHREYQWYAMDGCPERHIDMLVIDGPPGFIQKHSRYPALPLLHEALAERCVLYMDDAAREDEREIVKMWQSEFSRIEHRYVATERGCSVLTINK